MIVVVNPDVVVIGGGISAAFDLLRAPIEAELRERVHTTALDLVRARAGGARDLGRRDRRGDPRRRNGGARRSGRHPRAGRCAMTEASPQPHYRQIEQALRERISTLQPGARLPSDAELCAEFGVSRMTARNAMQRLAEDGLVARSPGAAASSPSPRRTGARTG